MDHKRWAGVLALTIAALLTVSPLGAAATTFEGSITATQPATWYGASVTADEAACEPGAEWDGFDAKWFDISDTTGTEALVELELPLRIPEVHWYDHNCEFEGATKFVAYPPASNCCLKTRVPSDASYVMVSAQAGSGDLTLTIGHYVG